MSIQDLHGKRVGIIGFGREGKAALSAIQKFCTDVEVTIIDRNDGLRPAFVSTMAGRQAEDDNSKTDIRWCTGEQYLSSLHQFDVLIKSPGVPPCAELNAVKDKVTSGTQIFFDTVMEKESLIIGVTGSKGKSTTSSLLYAILQQAGKDVHLVGNIGEPALDHISDAGPETIFVHELSSYQLMDMSVGPQMAVVTSFFPEHLDYHGSLELYKQAKMQIARFQTLDDCIFYSDQSADVADIAAESAGEHVPYSTTDAPVALADTKLIGEHNLLNIAGAWSVAKKLGVSQEIAVSAIQSFEGLPHRLQSLGVHHGIEWVNDAISTTPESAIAALDALGDRVQYIILGGQDRGNDFTELGKRIAASSLMHIVLFPESGKRIREAVENAGASVEFYEAMNMKEATEYIREKFSISNFKFSNPIALLSTASPSYNMYKNFEEKGKVFKVCVLSS